MMPDLRQLIVDKEDERAELVEPKTASLQKRSTPMDVRQLIVDKHDEGAELAEPETASLQRRSTQVDESQLIVENEKEETIEEAIRRPTSPATPKRGKRPTIAQLRELNRALKAVAPVPSTLHRTEAVMDLSVLDLETKTEAEEEKSQSEISDRATPSSDATVSFDKIEYIKCIDARGFPPEGPNTPQDQKTRAEPDDDPDIIGDVCYSCFLFFQRKIQPRGHVRIHQKICDKD